MAPRRAIIPFCALVLLLVSLKVELSAQTSAAPTTPEPKPATFPEDGYLSPDRYVNTFFGFWLEFPEQSYLRPIPLPFAPADRDDLLEVLGPVPAHAQISIAAFRAAEQRPDAKASLRKLLDQELSIGVEELHGLSKTNIAGHVFYTFETRRGIDQHAIYATEMNGYVVRFILSARDPKTVQGLQKCLDRIKFIPPESTRQYLGVGAIAYEGPSIPHHVLEAINADPPVNKIDPGTVQGNIYDNRQLALSYLLPNDWIIGREAAVQPAVERWRQRNAPQTDVGTTEHTLRQSCERILFSAWKTKPEPGKDILYDDFGEVTVSAMSLSCFPTLHFPSDLEQQNPIRDFLISYGLTHPIMKDMKGARAFETGGKIFVVSQGTVAYQTEGEALSRRVSIAIALTQQRGYLLSFFFAAPHDSELRELMNAKAAFDPEPSAQSSKAAAQAGGGESMGASMQQASASVTPPDANGRLAATGATPGPLSPAADTPAPSAPQPATSDPTPSPALEPKPSLLKPGESMQDQQMKGAPISKK